MSDNDVMNDSTDADTGDSAEELIEKITNVDPQDAPDLAERLARKLAAELESTEGRASSDTERPS